MGIYEIDVFTNKNESGIKAEEHKKQGRRVQVIEKNNFLYYDCNRMPESQCELKGDLDGNPLYIVISET